MKRTLLILAACSALVVVGHTQTSKPMGLSIRAGLVFPASGYGRDQGRTWFGVGGEYKLKDQSFGMNDRSSTGMLTLSADFYSKGQASALPLLVNYVGMKNELYYTFGAGLAFTHDEVQNGGLMVGRSKTNIGYQFGVGYNFQQGQNPVFAELKYFGNGNSNLNAFGLFLGVRL
ncbi:MAG: hypothetical protein ABL949_08805 [Fimbriimonadaceae bacterium]